jgi:hypothetical protein
VGTPWRGLNAAEDQAIGSILRRCLARWARTGLLAKVHALLAGMLRGCPDPILDSCSVRAKRVGDVTGPNPTDRAKRGHCPYARAEQRGRPPRIVRASARQPSIASWPWCTNHGPSPCCIGLPPGWLRIG